MKNALSFLLLSVLVPHLASAQRADLPTKWTKEVMASELPLAEYPRPQLKRRDWLCLNGWWEYRGGKDVTSASAPKAVAEFGKKPEKIHVPFCPESVLSGIKRAQEINMWYRRNFRVPDSWKGKRLQLHFEAVDHDATVFINGHLTGSHEGGYDGFSFDITDYVRPGENEVVVAAHDPNDGMAPGGKNGDRGDYTFTSGIWQSVWLEPVSQHYVRSIRLLPDLTTKSLAITVDADVSCGVKVTVLQGQKVVAAKTAMAGSPLILELENPITWSPDNPFLYDLHLTLTDAAGKPTDEVSSYFGMRSIGLGKVKGVMRPLLNGKFVMQVGLLDQGYWPDGIYTAPTDEALASDLVLAKRAGFNLVRKHMKVEPQRWYYWADKLGLLVWQDMPAIWYPDKDTAVNRSRYRKELKAMIDQHYNSPGIITWVPFNENWGAFDVREITDWIKNYDPSRLVNGNSGYNNNPDYQTAYGDPGNGDFVDTHLYSVPYKPSVPDGRRAASLGEFGGVGLFVPGHMWPVENNAYRYTATVSTLTDEYVLLLSQLEQCMKYKGLSVAVYTQTTDMEHEVNGILSYDRMVEKMEVARVKKINDWVVGESKGENE